MNRPPPDEPHVDAVATGLTRPSAPRGVPFQLIAVGFGIILFFVLTTWNPFWFILALPGWLFLKAKASRDLHIAEVITGWCFGAARTSNRRKWGGSTVSPLAPQTRRFGVF